MKSKITKLFDYRTLTVPPEMTRWRTPQSEIDKKLAAVALSHAEQRKVETVENGDAVLCAQTGEAVLAGRDTVLLYPGRNLPGAKEAESAVIGRKVGERFETSIGGKALTLEVRGITRNLRPEINDELVRRENVEGVETLEDYIRWFCGEDEEKRRQDACQEIAIYWIRQMAANSEADIVEEEQQAYMRESARFNYDLMVKVGEDPCIPEDGVEFLTEEQALAKLGEEVKPYFLTNAVCALIANERGVVIGEAELEKEYQAQAEYMKQSVEAAREQTPPEKLLELMYFEKAMELLAEEAAKFLEV